ncbi:2,3-diphosphoglycerate-dependent phosphoglycerate mutase [Candidatus Beckwithbacteria bacterium]|nr:2,3-diphosphoglycerate-dependent phosphoglycerate mutase [Candidatus Beckwithbacteria bacterium]
MDKYIFVLLRHGQSQWNLENRFTGWTDVPLTKKGEEEAVKAGEKMLESGLKFDLVYTNMLKRAIKTTWLALEQMDLMWLPIIKTWRLNERHYGALQGLNKSEMAAKYGENQVYLWRRSFDIVPPQVEITDLNYPGNDVRYQNLSVNELPKGESLKLTIDRVLSYWIEEIAPKIKEGKKILISASGNSLRALVKIIDKSISNESITEFNIPTGIPLIYELDENLEAASHRFLASDEELEAAINEIKNQGKK